MCGVILFTGVYQWPIAHYSYLPLQQPGLVMVGIAWINDIAFVFGRTEVLWSFDDMQGSLQWFDSAQCCTHSKKHSIIFGA